MSSPEEGALSPRVICVGDVHGNLKELEALWTVLQEHLGEVELLRTAVVFLGDYCDRGPETPGVLNWLLRLREERALPGRAPATFLLGNHDLGFAAFLGCLPTDEPPDADWLEATRDPRWTEGFFPHAVEGGMHYQGRRWGGLRSYNASSTFRAYGVEPEPSLPERMREELLAAVPAAHKEFLASLPWVHDQKVPWPPGRLLCVHAGLAAKPAAEEQLMCLRARDLTAPALREAGESARLAALSGRQAVLGMPKELKGGALLVSGHHGFRDLAHGHGDRVVLDRAGGVPGRPLEALLLPERTLFASDGSVLPWQG